MKQLTFRFSVACLTFLIGTMSICFPVKSRGGYAPGTAGQSLFIAEPKKEPKASLKLERVGDVPVQNELYPWNRIQFISEKDGWFKSEEKLWRTVDGGKTWQLIFDGGLYRPIRDSSYPSRNSIYDFQFISTEAGWVLLYGKMYKTEDGGRSWQPFAEQLMEQLGEKALASIYTFKFLPDGKRGWMAGGVYRPLKEGEVPPNRYSSADGKQGLFGVIFSTEDGGRSWRRQLLPGCGQISEMFFLDREHAWAVGTAGAYYLKNGWWYETETQATDERWNVVVGSLDVEIGAPTVSPSTVYFINPQLGWLSNSNGYLAKSTDGGKTWQDIVNLQDFQDKDWPLLSLERLHFRDSLHGLGLDTNGELRRTRDGGASWMKVETEMEVSDIYFLDSRTGWALSEDGLYRIGNF